jgi:hypothetical protein
MTLNLPLEAASAKPLPRIFPILATPDTEAGGVDFEDLAHQVEFVDKCGAHGMSWPQHASGCFDDSLEPWADDITQGVPKVKAGHLEPPDAPGIGVTFDEKAMAKHPYGPNNFLRLFEDGWEKRTGGSSK